MGAPRDHDTEKVRALLRRFYGVLRAATGAPFDADAAGDAELEYWVAHRRFGGETGRPGLIDANIMCSHYVVGDNAGAAARSHTRTPAVRPFFPRGTCVSKQFMCLGD